MEPLIEKWPVILFNIFEDSIGIKKIFNLIKFKIIIRNFDIKCRILRFSLNEKFWKLS